MVNRCQVCRRPVAGHIKLGCAPGIGNCHLTPLSDIEGGISPLRMGDTSASTITTASAPVTVTAPTSMAAGPSSTAPLTTSITPPVSNIPVTSHVGTPSTPSVTLSNLQLEMQLQQQVAELEAKVRLAEAHAEANRASNIKKLHSKHQELLQKLSSLGVTPQSEASAPPVNPFAPPTSSSGISATSFGVQASQAQLGQTYVTTAVQVPLVASAVAQSAIAGMSTNVASFPSSFIQQPSFAYAPSAPTPLGQSAAFLRSSLPDLQAPNPAYSHATGFAPSLSGSFAHAQSLPNINMAAINPESNPFLSPDDFYGLNPIAMAMLGMQSEARSDALRLGKYLPELFALRYAKLEDIRKQMSYQEFMHMYCRMLIFMLRDDPHLVPERLVFLYNIAAKAVKHRWSDVRNIYAIALQEMRHRRRGWTQDFTDIVNDMNIQSVNTGNRGGGGCLLISAICGQAPGCPWPNPLHSR